MFFLGTHDPLFSQRLAIQSLAQFCQRQFQCKIKAPKLVRRGLGGQKLHQLKAYPRLPNTSQYKLLLHFPPLGNDDSGHTNYAPHFVELGWTQGVKNGTNQNADPHSYKTSVHTAGLYCTVSSSGASPKTAGVMHKHLHFLWHH